MVRGARASGASPRDSTTVPRFGMVARMAEKPKWFLRLIRYEPGLTLGQCLCDRIANNWTTIVSLLGGLGVPPTSVPCPLNVRECSVPAIRAILRKIPRSGVMRLNHQLIEILIREEVEQIVSQASRGIGFI